MALAGVPAGPFWAAVACVSGPWSGFFLVFTSLMLLESRFVQVQYYAAKTWHETKIHNVL